MNTTSNREKFDLAVSLLAGDVAKNCEVITPEDLAVPLLFRIDEKVPKVFIPQMPYSAATSENRTVPRVVTATTFLGCIVGMATALNTYFGRELGEKSSCNKYQISGFEFEYGLSPNSKMVYDADYSDEMWLIAYSETTKAYKPIPYGVAFIHSVTTIAREHEKVNDVRGKFVIRVDDDRGMPLSNKRILKKGHYLVEIQLDGYGWGLHSLKKEKIRPLSFKDEKTYEVFEIDAKTFDSFSKINFGKSI